MGVIAAGGGRGLDCSQGKKGLRVDPLKALVAFEMRPWLRRKRLGMGVPEPKWWENPPKSLGFGSLQLGSSCGPGTGANPRWYHLFQLAHFSQPRQGGQTISHFRVSRNVEEDGKGFDC